MTAERIRDKYHPMIRLGVHQQEHRSSNCWSATTSCMTHENLARKTYFFYTFISFTVPGLAPTQNKTHHSPAQNPTFRRNPSSLPWPTYPTQSSPSTSTLYHKMCHLWSCLSASVLLFPPGKWFPRYSCGYGHSGLRSNTTSCDRTSQLALFSSTVPFYFPQSPCHSIKFLLTHLPFLPLKCKFHQSKHPIKFAVFLMPSTVTSV